MRRSTWTLGVVGCVWACNASSTADAPPAAGATPAPASTRAPTLPAPSASKRSAGPIRIETLEPDRSAPVFVMRGAPRGPGHLVFLHGMCGHGLGYAQSFQFSAAKLGTLIAPQGDVSCGGVWSKWSNDVVALDARIEATFRALGDDGPLDDVWIMGMSQGATRAAALARKFPERYTHLISMDAPTAIRPGDLKALRAAVLMAGERDRHDLMQASQRALAASGVPALYLVIPEAGHGAMGPVPEQTMGTALSFLRDNARSLP